MKRQHLHLCVYRCETCGGPVVAGSLGIRETEITKEIDIRQVGAVCLSCGQRQEKKEALVRHFPPIEWDLSFRGISGQEPACEVAGQARRRESTPLPEFARLLREPKIG
jgi:DNA-directed RNA polymerase subunit RPC12/RpoP